MINSSNEGPSVRIYLSTHNTPESQQHYLQLMTELLTSGKISFAESSPQEPIVAHVMLQYYEYLPPYSPDFNPIEQAWWPSPDLCTNPDERIWGYGTAALP